MLNILNLIVSIILVISMALYLILDFYFIYLVIIKLEIDNIFAKIVGKILFIILALFSLYCYLDAMYKLLLSIH